jgi:phage tail sheath gpL-like
MKWLKMKGLLAQMDRAAQRLEDYLQDRTWYKTAPPPPQ